MIDIVGRGREASPVGRPDFKSGRGREPVLGGFDSHSLPPVLCSCTFPGVRQRFLITAEHTEKAHIFSIFPLYTFAVVLLSNMALLAVLHRMGRRDVTVHGFRASFRSWAGHVKAEETDVLEAALAHIEKDETKKAYARDDYYERRIAVMSKWADYCALPGRGDVIRLLLRPAG